MNVPRIRLALSLLSLMALALLVVFAGKLLEPARPHVSQVDHNASLSAEDEPSADNVTQQASEEFYE